MNIIHLTKKYPNAIAGDAMAVMCLEAEQRKAGHNVDIIVSNTPAVLRGKHIHRFGLPIAQPDIDRINLKRMVSLAGLGVSSFWRLRKLRPDIIHSHSMDLGFFVRPAARFHRIPVINTCHGSSLAKPQLPASVRKLERFMLRHGGFRRIITVDETSVPAFTSAGLHHITYVPNGLNADVMPQRPAKPNDKFVIFFVGRLERDKGVGDLLQAVARLKNRDQLEVRLVSDGSMAAEYKALAHELGLDNTVKFLGQLPPRKTAKQFAAADMFVLPSYHEGFPIVILEAWAARLPLVTTSVGAMKTVCHHGEDALIITPGDVDALVQAIEALRDDEALRGKLAANGRKLVETTYNYDAIARRFQAIYDEVLA